MKAVTYALAAISILATGAVSVPVASSPGQEIFTMPAVRVELINAPYPGSYLCRSNDQRRTWSHQLGVDTNHIVEAINTVIHEGNWHWFANKEQIEWKNKACNKPMIELYEADIGFNEWKGRPEYRVVFTLPDGSPVPPPRVHFCGVMSHVGDRPKHYDFE
ncbi:hypothetical protein FRC07_003960, partial [Ceratobasidium sp. 392]